MELLEPDIIINGRYRVAEKIGQGGMGAVYEATDERLRNRVALKQTLVEGEAFSRAFEREAQLLAGLRHPALPRVIDHFVDGRGQFLVMDFIEGEDLAGLLKARGGPFPVAEVLRWADLLLDALEYLHNHNPPIVHRDIKPQNLKLTPRGELILLDFGLAKGSAAGGQPTRSSLFGYTPQFAPLEQVQGTGTDARSDIYSIGATLYNLLTGQPPADVIARAGALLNHQPDPLQLADSLNPLVPAMLAGAIQQAMAMASNERFASAAAMRRAIGAAHTAPLEPITGPTIVARDGAPGAAQPLATARISQPTNRPPSQPTNRPPSQPNPFPVSQPPDLGFAPASTDDFPTKRERRERAAAQRRERRGGIGTGCLISFLITVVVIGGVIYALLQGVGNIVANADPATVQTSLAAIPTYAPTVEAAISSARQEYETATADGQAPARNPDALLENATPISFSELISGTITAPGQLRAYRFAAAEGQRIFIETVSYSAGMEQIDLKLLDEDGEAPKSGCLGCGNIGALTIEQTGDYLLIVGDDTDAATGTFELRVTDSQ
jgi:serine/threonine protein kinase